MSKKEIKLIDRISIFDTELNVYGSFEEPYFMAKEVADWIDYSYTDKNRDKRNVKRMVKNIDEDYLQKYVVGRDLSTTSKSKKNDKSRNTQEMVFIAEDGLYDLLMISRNKKAKSFKKEVRKLLKKIRKINKEYVFNENSLNKYTIIEKEKELRKYKNLLKSVLNEDERDRLASNHMWLEQACKEYFTDLTFEEFMAYLYKLDIAKDDGIKTRYITKFPFFVDVSYGGCQSELQITELGILYIRHMIDFDRDDFDYDKWYEEEYEKDERSVLHLRRKKEA